MEIATIQLKDNKTENCMSDLGYILVHRRDELPTSLESFWISRNVHHIVILEPKIVTTDESLKKFSPEM